MNERTEETGSRDALCSHLLSTPLESADQTVPKRRNRTAGIPRVTAFEKQFTRAARE
jgi:hypothetical protein